VTFFMTRPPDWIDLAIAVDETHADEAVARRAVADAAGAGNVAGRHRADGRLALRAIDGAMVHRLEGEDLVVRASAASISAIGVPARARMTCSAGSWKTMPDSALVDSVGCGLHGPAEASARAAAANGERRAAVARGQHHGDGFGFVVRNERAHAASLPSSGNTLAGLSSHFGSNTARTRICWRDPPR
jgi:hypothetical protein